jgi:hypothetical protein
MTERESEPTGAEVPVEDALEQRTDVSEQEPTTQSDREDEVIAESDPADRAEQGLVVDTGDTGEDDYPR